MKPLDSRDIPLLFLSTCSNYGKTDKVVTEDSSLEPLGLYADSKIQAEEIVLDNNQLVLRMSTLFGASYRVRYDITINDFVYQYYRDKLLKVYGEDTWRPYLHIEDACNMIVQSMDKDLFRNDKGGLIDSYKFILNKLQETN